MFRYFVFLLLLTDVAPAQRFRMYLSEKPAMSLEQALPIAAQAARTAVPELDQFVLNSVEPRAFKNDPKGEHWEFLWQELPFKTHFRGIAVRVYMRDGSTVVKESQQ